MGELLTPQGLVVGLIIDPDETEKKEKNDETPPEKTEGKRGRRKAEK